MRKDDELRKRILDHIYRDVTGEDMSLKEFRTRGNEARGRIIAKGLQMIETRGGQIAPNLKVFIDSGDFEGLANSFDGYLSNLREEKINSLSQGTGRDLPDEWKDYETGERMTREQYRHAVGENLLQVLQSLGIIDPGL